MSSPPRNGAIALAMLGGAGPAFGAGEPPASNLNQREIQAWLDAPHEQPNASDRSSPNDVPPSPPRARGFVVEGGAGAFGHTGPMRWVSPVAPRFALHLGYEFLQWLSVFAEGDLVFATTSRANPPPKPRSYTLYGFGGGLRFHLPLSERFGFQLEGAAGLAEVREDILGVYGYKDADELSAYFGGRLGLEWYPVNPHYTVSLFGGARDYPQFQRLGNRQPPVAWQSGIAFAYTL